MPWLLYSLFEIFIWVPHIRYAVVGAHPVIQMGASVLNDIVWLPPAIALPIYCLFLIRKIFRQLVWRDIIFFVFFIFWILSVINIDTFFRLQFIFILIFFTLWSMHIFQSRTISLRIIYFAIALLPMIAHYNTQLVPFPRQHKLSNISVMTFNVNTKAAFDDERTIQFVRQRVPDIVFLQELSTHEQHFITAQLGDLYPYMLLPARGFGKNDVMILSRKKIVCGDQIRLQTSSSKSYHSINHAIIELNGRNVHLLNCHLYHAFKELHAYIDSPDSGDLFEQLKTAYGQQQEQAELLAEYVNSLVGPIILAGDFNDTANSLTYARFKKRYTNAFAAVGWGLGTTFGEWVMRQNLPGVLRILAFDSLRIDHVFFSHDFIIRSAKVDKISAFDHYPQIVTAYLK